MDPSDPSSPQDRPPQVFDPNKVKVTPGLAVAILAIPALFIVWQVAHHSGVGLRPSVNTTPPSVEPAVPSNPLADRVAGWVACQHFVRARLRAPSTADFPWYNGQGTVSGGTYTVKSYVDAQNAFGAKVRTTFTCAVSTRAADGGKGSLDSWTVELLVLNE